VADVFTASGAVVEVGPRYHLDQPDLAIWHNELEATLGNPVLIETKLKVAHPADAARQLARYMSAAGTSWGLLLIAEPYTSGRKGFPPGVLAFGIEDLLVKLRDAPLPRVITQARNRVMHGLD
jgi:hypothetical protein